jgi:hypothetical protein
MSEFNDRVAAQRRVLQIVNSKDWDGEQLFGLSRNAIERFAGSNNLDPNSGFVKLIESASSKLFFLANKSQEQISEEYKAISADIAQVANELQSELSSF